MVLTRDNAFTQQRIAEMMRPLNAPELAKRAVAKGGTTAQRCTFGGARGLNTFGHAR
jgi:hypothetical protein